MRFESAAGIGKCYGEIQGFNGYAVRARGCAQLLQPRAKRGGPLARQMRLRVRIRSICAQFDGRKNAIVRVSAPGIADAGAGAEQGRLQVARKTPAELIRPGRSNTEGAIRGKRQCKYGEFSRLFGEFPLFLFVCSLFAVAGRINGASLRFRLRFGGINFAGLPPLEAARNFLNWHNRVF
jgi:hypothetical protein